MPLTAADLPAVVERHLTEAERARAVAYAAKPVMAAGSRLAFPRVLLGATHESFIVFVDGDPTANWSHRCRYLLIERESGAVHSVEAQLPPFTQQPEHFCWRVMYHAPGVPASALAAPQLPKAKPKPE